jgi:maltooligosyltrehalose trehalohydrolase
VPPDVPSTRFVTCLQNHDQVGNRAAGDRITTLASPRSCEVAAALALLGPFTPLLFMGEEWGATTPWPYFTSFPDPELGDQVRAGRRAEFADHGWDPDLVPDPQSIATRDSAVLQWIERSAPASKRFLDWYRTLLALRRQHHLDLVNRPRDIDLAVDDERRAITRLAGSLLVTANLDQDEVELPLPKAAMDTAEWELLACNDERCSVGSGWALLGPTTTAIYRVVR